MGLKYLSHPAKKLVSHIHVLTKNKLWLQVIIGLILGIFVGILLGPDIGLVSAEKANVITNWLALPGNLFLQLIKMIIVPLIFSSIIMGIIASSDPEFLKKIGPKIFLYFLFTTTIATIIGFGVAFLFQPGNYIDTSNIHLTNNASVESGDLNLENIPDKIVSVIPNNPLAAVVKGDLLGVVIFTILFGIALLFVQRRYRETMARVLRATQDATLRIVGWAMLLAPFAVFGLMTRITSQVGFTAFLGLGMYILTVLTGLALMLCVYILIVGLVSRRNPVDFFKSIAPVQLLAFSTSSSAAVMPLSMKTAEKELKIEPAISRFIIPIGATINMDGTALYQVVATIFLAQAFGISLPITALIGIILLTLGASIGAPAAPGIGIVILATILDSVGVPGAGIALILGVDRILDMARTTINVTGDLTACSVFDKHLSHNFKKQ